MRTRTTILTGALLLVFAGAAQAQQDVSTAGTQVPPAAAAQTPSARPASDITPFAPKFGQVDFGFQYKITENLRLGGQMTNLTNQVYKQYMQQQIGLKLHNAFYTGRTFAAQLNYSF